MSLLIRGARILALDDAGNEHACADIRLADGIIQAIGPDLDAQGAEVIEAAGLLAMPGLVNGHFHAQQNLMIGTVPGLPLELFMLHEVPPPGVPGPSPELVRLQTLLGAVEMLEAGVTAVHDDAFHNPGPTRAGIDAMMGADAIGATADFGIAIISTGVENAVAGRIASINFKLCRDRPDPVETGYGSLGFLACRRRWPSPTESATPFLARAQSPHSGLGPRRDRRSC